MSFPSVEWFGRLGELMEENRAVHEHVGDDRLQLCVDDLRCGRAGHGPPLHDDVRALLDDRRPGGHRGGAGQGQLHPRDRRLGLEGDARQHRRGRGPTRPRALPQPPEPARGAHPAVGRGSPRPGHVLPVQRQPAGVRQRLASTSRRRISSRNEPDARIGHFYIEDTCIGCGACDHACPGKVDAIYKLEDDFIGRFAIVLEDCIDCGFCVPMCPVDCIRDARVAGLDSESESGWTRIRELQALGPVPQLIHCALAAAVRGARPHDRRGRRLLDPRRHGRLHGQHPRHRPRDGLLPDGEPGSCWRAPSPTPGWPSSGSPGKQSRGRVPDVGAWILTALDAGIIVTLIGLTGLWTSPMLPILVLVVFTQGVRFSLQRALVVALATTAALVTVMTLVPEPDAGHAERLRMAPWWSWMLLSGAVLAGVLSHAADLAQRKRARAEAAASGRAPPARRGAGPAPAPGGHRRGPQGLPPRPRPRLPHPHRLAGGAGPGARVGAAPAHRRGEGRGDRPHPEPRRPARRHARRGPGGGHHRVAGRPSGSSRPTSTCRS